MLNIFIHSKCDNQMQSNFYQFEYIIKLIHQLNKYLTKNCIVVLNISWQKSIKILLKISDNDLQHIFILEWKITSVNKYCQQHFLDFYHFKTENASCKTYWRFWKKNLQFTLTLDKISQYLSTFQTTMQCVF